MPKDDLLHAAFADIDAADPVALKRLARDRAPVLMRMPGTAAALLSGNGADEERRLILFDVLANEARMNVENRGRGGDAFLEEAREAISALIAEGGLDLDMAAMLARIYGGAELETPEELLSFLLEAAEPGIDVDAGGVLEDLEAQISDLLLESDGDIHGLHMYLTEMLGGAPAQIRPDFVEQLAGGGAPWCGRLALYWLLDPSEDMRIAAAAALGERAELGALDAATASALPLVRSWLPADGATPVLDAALRTARRRGIARAPERPELRLARLAVSLPDGSGSQSVTMELEGPAGPAAALALVKAGFGVKDAFMVRGEDARQVLPLQLAEGSMELDRAALEPALAAALADGLSAGVPPAPGLIDIAEACGLEELRPRPMTARDWLAHVDPAGEIAALERDERERLISESADWPLEHGHVGFWFEGTGFVDEALEGIDDPRLAEAALWAALDERRGFWTLLMARAAHVLKSAAGEPDWRSFAATAAALIDGEALDRIMEHVLGASVAAWRAEDAVLEGDGRRAGA